MIGKRRRKKRFAVRASFQAQKGKLFLRRSLAVFLRRRRARFISTALAFEWATESSRAAAPQQAQRLSAARLFAMFRKIADPRTEVPPKDLLPYRPKRGLVHIYTASEIAAIMRALEKLPLRRLKRRTFTTIFGLLAVTGCRSGEILQLSDTDVDFKHRRLVIRFGKGGNSRLIPLHSSTVAALRRYAKLRDATLPRRETFFVSTTGSPVAYSELERAFLRASKEIGLRGANAKRGPRLHDLRHTFAVRTILAWYKRSVPVESRLPVLSAFLGHVKPSDTYWYLTGVPELLALAAGRLQNFRG